MTSLRDDNTHLQNPVIDAIDALITERHMLSHTFYEKWKTGSLSLGLLKGYAIENFHHVNVFPRYISAIHSNCDDIAIRQELLENLIEEERGEENHPELWLRFTDALGLPREDVIDARFLPETASLVDNMLSLGKSTSVAEGLSALYCYEAQIPEVCEVEIEGLKEHYGIKDKDALAFFTVHMEADIVHRQVGRDILAQLVGERNRTPVLDAAIRTLDSLNDFLTGIMSRYP